jgi:hypothetical protein
MVENRSVDIKQNTSDRDEVMKNSISCLRISEKEVVMLRI